MVDSSRKQKVRMSNMNRIVILLLAIMSASVVWGQEKKVAMLEPIVKGGSVTQIEKDIILGTLEEAITNVPGYRAFTRLDVNQITKELSFQQSGMVDETQRKKIGQLSGASLICISQLTAGDNILIKSSLVEVETGEIINTVNQLMKKDETAIYEGCIALANKLVGGGGSNGGSSSSRTSSGSRQHPAEPEMVFVQGGTFWMGCSQEQQGSCDDDESPLHSVTVSSFHIGKYEVTQAQWKLIMGNNPSNFKGDNLPVENVSWHDAQEFISRLNAATGKRYRLPTEAEWEYAARGGNKSAGYKYSGSHNLNNVAWFKDNSGSTTHVVGTQLPNELGIYDMSGNVREWCSDWYGSYSTAAQRDPIGANSSSYRVGRGGSWYGSASSCTVSIRGDNTPSYRDNNVGFRVVLVP
jgi:formylglycine-generating enzyme required for sulfatase activity